MGNQERTSRVFIEKVRDISSYGEIRNTLFKMFSRMNGEFKLPRKGSVLIKLNLCLLKGPETGATVDLRIARVLIEWLLEKHEPGKIYLAEADATHLSADMAFKILGWGDLCNYDQRVEWLNLSLDDSVKVGGEHIKDLKMAKKMMEADLLVSLAKLKTHTQQKITGIMKNQFGAIPFKYKIVYHSNLAEAICDAVAARKPDLCFIDGLVAMEGNGPTNGTPRRTGLVLGGNDAVAMDHFCARLMGFNPLSIPNIRLGHKRGLGNIRYEVIGSPPDPINLRFKFLPKWKEVIKKGIGIMQRKGINEEA